MPSPIEENKKVFRNNFQVIRSDFSFIDRLLELIELSLTSTEKVSVNLCEIIFHPTNKIVPNQIIPDRIKI